jgi:hypothetical protein
MMMQPVSRFLVDVEQPFLIDLVRREDWQCSHHASGGEGDREQTRPPGSCVTCESFHE